MMAELGERRHMGDEDLELQFAEDVSRVLHKAKDVAFQRDARRPRPKIPRRRDGNPLTMYRLLCNALEEYGIDYELLPIRTVIERARSAKGFNPNLLTDFEHQWTRYQETVHHANAEFVARHPGGLGAHAYNRAMKDMRLADTFTNSYWMRVDQRLVKYMPMLLPDGSLDLVFRLDQKAINAAWGRYLSKPVSSGHEATALQIQEMEKVEAALERKAEKLRSSEHADIEASMRTGLRLWSVMHATQAALRLATPIHDHWQSKSVFKYSEETKQFGFQMYCDQVLLQIEQWNKGTFIDPEFIAGFHKVIGTVDPSEELITRMTASVEIWTKLLNDNATRTGKQFQAMLKFALETEKVHRVEAARLGTVVLMELEGGGVREAKRDDSDVGSSRIGGGGEYRKLIDAFQWYCRWYLHKEFKEKWADAMRVFGPVVADGDNLWTKRKISGRPHPARTAEDQLHNDNRYAIDLAGTFRSIMADARSVGFEVRRMSRWIAGRADKARSELEGLVAAAHRAHQRGANVLLTDDTHSTNVKLISDLFNLVSNEIDEHGSDNMTIETKQRDGESIFDKALLHVQTRAKMMRSYAKLDRTEAYLRKVGSMYSSAWVSERNQWSDVVEWSNKILEIKKITGLYGGYEMKRYRKLTMQMTTAMMEYDTYRAKASRVWMNWPVDRELCHDIETYYGTEKQRRWYTTTRQATPNEVKTDEIERKRKALDEAANEDDRKKIEKEIEVLIAEQVHLSGLYSEPETKEPRIAENVFRVLAMRPVELADLYDSPAAKETPTVEKVLGILGNVYELCTIHDMMVHPRASHRDL